ncbi:recombinase family protein [Ureibacillus chungkukjangi]|uniref:DNA invertase Pin-like site-specific DNA recombinase n=1 Tax=Ureibacillus chungkukjangi TaxID=1202712 RepID=A0A318TT21_9BACL|nr:recombinase family protein [Ureibacillus chungkukjangi]MCM3388164.1 recombinase family protein [Ureibacillus chungkukjangi]MDI7743991.1 recombinase family protein [Lysinibacillus fusiformis]PYF06178.1 DNA invertase Pin-like site-specific DNA recombinase [Ureibacillus chungkukjangi]
MIYGYIRPLYDDKKIEKQHTTLNKKCDEIYYEEHGSPKKRTQLEALLMKIEPGDMIFVERMIVLADSSRHLSELLKVCEKDDVTIRFINEDIKSNELLNIRLNDLMVHILQFQTDIVKQSTTIGMDQAKRNGKSFGRPKKSDDSIQKAISMYHAGFKLHDIKNETGISKSTLYRYLESADNK